MSGYKKASYVKGPLRRISSFLFVRKNGSIDVNVLALGSVKSTVIEFTTNESVKLPGVAYPKRKSLTLCPIIDSSGMFYIGGSDVTVDNGLPLSSLEYYSIDIGENADLWGVADTSGEVRILELAEYDN